MHVSTADVLNVSLVRTLADRLLGCPSALRPSPCSTTMLHQTRGPNWHPQCASRQWEVYVPSITGATKATLTTPTCPGSSEGTGTSLFASDARPRFPHMKVSWVHAHTHTYKEYKRKKKQIHGIHVRNKRGTMTRMCSQKHTRAHSNDDRDLKLKSTPQIQLKSKNKHLWHNGPLVALGWAGNLSWC